MITDEQVKVATNTYLNRPIDSYVANGNFTDMRKALEAYEQSKWVKFDIDDESTHPLEEMWCVTNLGAVFWRNKNCTSDHFRPRFVRDEYGSSYIANITNWQHLPEFKG